MGWFSAYVKRCSPVYHHDNSGDGDITIGESFGGGGRVGTKCGIFFDNDQVSINSEWCSSALTIVTIAFAYYHNNDGDGGKAVNEVYGGVYRAEYWTGIFYDEDMVAIYGETGSTILTL